LLGAMKVMKGRLWDGHLSSWGLSWATWSGLISRGLRDVVERGSRVGVSLSLSLSVGALRKEPRGRAPLLGTLRDR
jgi:hypothetical protein